jgi:hypothetical protein
MNRHLKQTGDIINRMVKDKDCKQYIADKICSDHFWSGKSKYSEQEIQTLIDEYCHKYHRSIPEMTAPKVVYYDTNKFPMTKRRK